MKRIYVKNEDGTETEITEGVQALYDHLIGSLDWGSGFISTEDAVPIAHLARTCDFNAWEEAEKYVTRLEEINRLRKSQGRPPL